jgi:PIN domain nuclease of toxin-antitoxin system
MKNFLLDTHVLLWAIVDMDELSQKVQAVLQDSDNHMTVSSLSLWQIGFGKYNSKFYS